MAHVTHRFTALRLSLSLAVRAVRAWTIRQVVAAGVAAVVVGTTIGMATVLIPNPVFTREIPTVPWNYPAWMITSVLTGMLVATYIRPAQPAGRSDPPEEPGLPPPDDGRTTTDDADGRRTGRMGIAGAVLAWFAVGCPVCNKLALLALGYTGALTWFAPAQPYLAAAATVLLVAALVWRLRGQVACAGPNTNAAVTA